MEIKNDINYCVRQNVPFSGDLPKDLAPGKTICVTGLILPNCPRFSVNITAARSPTADILLHINPRLHQRYVVRNSRFNGQWGDEETTSPAKFPFERSRRFLLSVCVGDGEFLVAVNGVHHSAYAFRAPLERAVGIEVQGAVDVLSVDYRELKSYPEQVEAQQVASGRRDEEAAVDTPVTFLLPAGFQRDWQLEIYGRVKILPHSFYVNLQEGSHLWPHPIIPLHLNPRFSMGRSAPLFVRNAWIEGGWGQEERTPGFQFTPGSPFTMAIQRGNDHFSVWIDGKLAGEFKFRGDVDNIDTVHIQGDVVIFDVILNKHPETITNSSSLVNNY